MCCLFSIAVFTVGVVRACPVSVVQHNTGDVYCEQTPKETATVHTCGQCDGSHHTFLCTAFEGIHKIHVMKWTHPNCSGDVQALFEFRDGSCDSFPPGSQKQFKMSCLQTLVVPPAPVGGPIRLDHGCIASHDEFTDYPPKTYANKVESSFTLTPLPILVREFRTEIDADTLSVNGQMYSGSVGPSNVVPVGAITWKTDSSVTRRGFDLCPCTINNMVSTASLEPPPVVLNSEHVDGVGTVKATVHLAHWPLCPGHRVEWVPEMWYAGSKTQPPGVPHENCSLVTNHTIVVWQEGGGGGQHQFQVELNYNNVSKGCPSALGDLTDEQLQVNTVAGVAAHLVYPDGHRERYKRWTIPVQFTFLSQVTTSGEKTFGAVKVAQTEETDPYGEKVDGFEAVLDLMTDNFTRGRRSSQYALGDLIEFALRLRSTNGILDLVVERVTTKNATAEVDLTEAMNTIQTEIPSTAHFTVPAACGSDSCEFTVRARVREDVSGARRTGAGARRTGAGKTKETPVESTRAVEVVPKPEEGSVQGKVTTTKADRAVKVVPKPEEGSVQGKVATTKADGAAWCGSSFVMLLALLASL